MADKKKGGRYTPKAGGAPAPTKPTSKPASAKTGKPASNKPASNQPISGKSASTPARGTATDGASRRGRPAAKPAPPGFLFGIAAFCFLAAFAFMSLTTAAWRIVPALLGFAIGIAFLRSALRAVIHNRDLAAARGRSSKPDREERDADDREH
jgi:hypothetical protein